MVSIVTVLVALVVTTISVFVLVKSRGRRGRKAVRQRVFGGILLGVGLLFVAAPFRVTRFADGSYPQAEFQLTFNDTHGVALQGVELRLEDQEAHSYYHYPVIDYFPGNVPTSDRDGAMIFHHISDGIEFSGTTTYWFGVWPTVGERAPVFLCRFLHNGQEVYRIGFRELCRSLGTSSPVPKVPRVWKWPIWPESQFLREAQGDADLLREQEAATFRPQWQRQAGCRGAGRIHGRRKPGRPRYLRATSRRRKARAVGVCRNTEDHRRKICWSTGGIAQRNDDERSG